MPNSRISFASRFVLAVLFVALGSAAYAQYAGSLRGSVRDTTGAVVPGATVTLLNEATRFSRNVVSSDQGEYYFGAVQPGTYTLTVEISGFKTRSVKGVRMAPSATASVDVTLDVGQQSEVVEVTAEREMIQTDTGAREGLITAEQIENLSIISRSPLELLRILPGVVSPEPTRLESVGNLTGANNTNGGVGQSYNVNGVRGSNTVITLDGSRLMDIGSNNGVIVAPNNDFVSEVKVQSSNYAAEYGSAGVQINAITKGGSSEFHGSVFDYIRHHKFAANDRSNTIAGIDRPKSQFQYPGGNLSGPILIPGTDFNKDRDKAFFFIGIERQLQKVDQGASFGVVPTLGQRRGFFNDYQSGQNLNQPTTVLIPRGFPGEGTPAPNNDLSPYLTPFGRMLLNQYPLPNYNDPTGRYNYVFSKLQPQNRWQFMARFDYSFSENTKAYLRLARDDELLEHSRGAWWNASEFELPTPLNHDNKGISGSLNLTSVLSPSTTNEVLFTYSKLYLDIYHQDPSKISLSALGFPEFGAFFGQQFDKVPQQPNWSGQGAGGLWDPMGQDVFAYNYSLQLRDTFTKVLDTHALKFGFSVEQVGKDQNFHNYEEGYVITGPGWTPGSTNSHYGDILVGRFNTFHQGTRAASGNFRLWNIDFFAQDAWKVKKNLTLEYGVRVSKMTNNVEKNDLGAFFDPDFYDPTKGTFVDDQFHLNGVRYVALGQTDRSLIGSRPIYVMPRLNFAWDVNGKGDWIVRGGGGLFYNRPMGNAEYDVVRVAPHAFGFSYDAWSGEGLGGGRGLTYDTLSLVDPFTVGFGRIGFGGDGSVNKESVEYPRYFTTSLGVARRLPWNQVLEVSYVGTFGRHLLNQRRINVIPPGTLSRGQVGNSDLSVPVNRVALSADVVNSFRPFPTIGDVHYWEYNGTSNYHGLQATLSRTGRRFQYLMAYTFSKAMGTWDHEYTDIDPFEPRQRSYGVLPYDRTHILNVSYNWQLPDFVTGGNAFTRGLINGWQVSGISSFYSGVPMPLGFSGDINGDSMEQAWWGTPDHETPGGNLGRSQVMPVFLSDPRGGGTGVGDRYLNIGAIGIPTFPNSGPFIPSYYIRSPNRMNHDFSIFKNFSLGGSKKLQFRAGLFNIFNQAYPTFGVESWTDMDLQLNTTCNRRVNGVPNGAGGTQDNQCDPTGGFSFTPQTLENFGKVLFKRGHRVVEFALKFYF